MAKEVVRFHPDKLPKRLTWSKSHVQKDTSEEDRRTAPRVKVNLPARWEGVLFHQEAAVTSLSRTGCFVLTAGKVQENELIWLEIIIPNQPPIYLWAEVVDQAYEIGFAVRFNSSSGKADVLRLDAYIRDMAKTVPSADYAD